MDDYPVSGDNALPPIPPADHPRRCKGRNRELDRQCTKWAMRGADYCASHRGRRQLGSNRMANRYARFLGPKLKDAVEAFQNSEDKQEQLRIHDEIAVMRGLLQEQIAMAQAALDAKDVTDATKNLAIEVMRMGLNNVAELCAKAAQIEKNLSDKISVDHLNFVIQQLCKIISDETKEQPAIADRILERFDNDVQLPCADVKTNQKILVKVDYD